MDAGLAAVIAGAAGAGGAALAAFGTSFAMVKQAKMQRDSAHHLWLRNHQQQAFEELLIAAHRMKGLFSSPKLELDAPSRTDEAVGLDLERYFEEHQVRSAAVAAAVARVSLLADLKTGSCAFILGTAMSDLGLAVLRQEVAKSRSEALDVTAAEELDRLWDRVHTASTDFAFHAQQALQEA